MARKGAAIPKLDFAARSINLICDGKVRSKYSRLADLMGFGDLPRLGRMVGTIVLLPRTFRGSPSRPGPAASRALKRRSAKRRGR
jgi:hypothetical protein